MGDVHDLHVWQLTSGMNVATAHLVTSEHGTTHEVLDRARQELETRFGIAHATLQVEPADHRGLRRDDLVGRRCFPDEC